MTPAGGAAVTVPYNQPAGFKDDGIFFLAFR